MTHAYVKSTAQEYVGLDVGTYAWQACLKKWFLAVACCDVSHACAILSPAGMLRVHSCLPADHAWTVNLACVKLGALEMSAPVKFGEGDQISNLAVGDFSNAARDRQPVQI
jgi:hypothetical protein